MRTYSMKKPIILLLIVINIVYLNVKVSFAEETERNHILILNSYHKGYKWTDDNVKGIESILKNNDNVIRIEYMDTKIKKDDKQLSVLYELYKHKFNNYKFDVIIASDNDAYNFLKKYHGDLFGDTPIICDGLNSFDDFITNKKNGFTGIAETLDIKDTLDVSFKLHKDIKNVVVIADESLASDLIIEIIKNIMPLYGTNKQFYFSQNDSIEEQKSYLSKIPKNSIVIQIGIYKDEFEEPITVEEGDRIISESTDAPIYTFWEMHLGNGIIGGMLTSSYTQGKIVAQMALQVLSGKNIKEIPFIQKSQNTYVFDYNSMQEYNIKASDLPANSTIKNKPDVILRLSKKMLNIIMVFVSALLILINFFMYKNILKLKKVKKENIKEKIILEAILDSTGDGILVVDKDRRKINHNNKFANMWAISEDILARDNNMEMINYVKNMLIYPDEFIKSIKEKS
ncbi:MAG: ABC-type uncharacterized transport system substrate-binding protein, partial [Clostridium sp.]